MAGGRRGAPASRYDHELRAAHQRAAAGRRDARTCAAATARGLRARGTRARGTRARAAGSGTGFFDWLRSLKLPRTPGWIGGVAAGIAARLGIDPMIVRGVLVVFALFGAPVFLAYGIAWLLLPDEHGRIHLEQTIRGVFDNALVGIGIFVLVGLVPWGWAPWAPFAWDGPWFDVFNPLGLNWWPVFWTLVGLGAIAWFIVWVVRRARADAAAQGGGTASPSDGSGPSSQADANATATATAATGTRTAAASAGAAAAGVSAADGTAAEAPPGPPQPPAGGYGTPEYDAWRVQYDAWKADLDAWKRSQAEANRAARAQVAAESRAAAVALQAQAEAARAERRRTRPRTSFAFVVATFGAAMLAGAIGSFTALASSTSVEWALPIGLAAAALVTALSMVLAGVLRRRSGFLGFATVVLLVATLGTATGPRTEFAWANDGGAVRTATVVQPVGDLRLTLDEAAADRPGTPRMTVLQGAGSITVAVAEGTRLSLDVECGSCFVELARVVGGDGGGEWQYFDGMQLTAGRDSVSTWHREIGPGLEAGVEDAHLTIRAGATRITIVQSDEEL
ncbi:PspC domain-containing protein [Agromyces sp. LHK192]|uniref:PspC domain-containing protein n=1 Tax=Agromyces sp. LHK192 TaxID=2498704 RepID=UPI000FD82947|nr:PspC domain-containing protein [Agromyces sp. LHK192]